MAPPPTTVDETGPWNDFTADSPAPWEDFKHESAAAVAEPPVYGINPNATGGTNVAIPDNPVLMPESPTGFVGGVERGLNLGVGAALRAIPELFTPPRFDRSVPPPDKIKVHGADIISPPGPDAERLTRARLDPLYKLGHSISENVEDIPASTSMSGKVGEAVGGMIPLVVAPEAAPALIGLQAAGETIDQTFEDAKQSGLDDDAAARKALQTGMASGVTQATIWEVLPGPLKKVLGKATGLVGEGAVRQFLARRAATTAGGAVLGAATRSAQNLETARPVGEGVAESAAGFGVLQGVLPSGLDRPVPEKITPQPFADARQFDPLAERARGILPQAAQALSEVQPTTAKDIASGEEKTLESGNAPREPNQLQAGQQAESKSGGRTPPLDEATGLEASVAWLQGIIGNDSTTISDAASKLLGEYDGGEAGSKVVPPDSDRTRSSLRAPGDNGGASGSETSNERARSPQERERSGQSIGESGSSDSLQSREGAPSPDAGEMGSALRQLRDLQNPEQAALGARTLLKMLSEAGTPKLKSQIVEQIKESVRRQKAALQSELGVGAPKTDLEQRLENPDSFKSKNWTKDALEYGAGLDPQNPEAYEELKRLESKYSQELKAVPKTMENFQRISELGTRKQWVTEALQGAEGLGERSVGQEVLGKDYKPPFPLEEVAPNAKEKEGQAQGVLNPPEAQPLAKPAEASPQPAVAPVPATETPKTPLETLNTAQRVRVKAPEGATQLRVTTTKGKSAVRPLATVNKGANQFRGADVAKVEAGTIGADGKFKPLKGDVQIVGMGGAVPSEFGGNESPTSIKNEMVDQERAERGLPPAAEPLRRAFGTVWDEAMAAIDRSPSIVQNLVNELRDKPRALTDLEDALLLHQQVNLQNEYHNAAADLVREQEGGRPDFAVEARLRLAAASDQLLDLYNIGKSSGTETGRGLSARRMLANEDFSLAAMELRKRAAKDGAPLTDAQRKEIADLHQKLADTQKAFDEYRAKMEQRGSEAAADATVKQMKARNPKAPKGEAADDQARIVAGLKARKAEGDTPANLGNWIQALAENFVRGGVTEREPLVDAVHGVVAEVFPEWSRRETMDAISGYGDFKKLNPDQIKTQLRGLRGEMQQVAKLEDMSAGQAPAKTGVERRTPTDEERRLIKLVNEAKKKGGFTTTDPATQLKSALDAVKTRLRNQIADLDFQISTGKKTVKERGAVPTDAEADALRAKRDALKTQFEEVFGKPEMTDEQRIKLATGAVERSIADLEARLKTGDISPRNAPSKTPVTPELEALRAKRDALSESLQELRDAANPKKTPEERALQAYKTRTAKRIAELTDKLAQGDFSKKARQPVKLDSEGLRLQAANERLKQKFREGVERDRLKNRSKLEKVLDATVKWTRASFLSSPQVLLKLVAATAARVGFTPVEEVIGAGLDKLPGLRGISARAPREGGGVNLKAEVKSWTEGLTSGMKDAWQRLTTGRSDLDALYGRKDIVPRTALDFFSNLHGALKAPLHRAEFARALEKRGLHAEQNGADISDPLVQTSLQMKAYSDAERATLQQRNFVASKVRRFIDSFEEKSRTTGRPTVGGKLAATTGRQAFPITTVPLNLVGETLAYATGLPTGALRARAAIRRGVENLQPEEADLIMRELKKGLLGPALLLAGFFGYQAIGGYYEPGKKRKASDVQPGNIRVPGLEVPKAVGGPDVPRSMLHNPGLENLQLGASVRRVAEERLKGKPRGLPSGVLAGMMGLLEETPYVAETVDVAKLREPGQGMRVLHEMAASRIVPGLSDQIARHWDLDANGKPVKRRPENFVQTLESRIPGARKLVPSDTRP